MQPMLNIALRAARKAATHISRSVGQLDRIEVSSKGVNDFVTEVDHAAERIVISELQRTYPEHAILGEESGFIPGSRADKAGQEEYVWVIDPLDGTTNFIHGLPHFLCVCWLPSQWPDGACGHHRPHTQRRVRCLTW